MKRPRRSFAAAVAVVLLGFATVAGIRAVHPDRDRGPGDPTAPPDVAAAPRPDMADSPESNASGRTKSPDRESDLERARRRLRQQQLEVDEALTRYLPRHPAAARQIAKLNQLKAEEAAAASAGQPPE